MTAAFQANVTIIGDTEMLEAFKQQINVLLSEASPVQNLQEQYISQDLIYRLKPIKAFLSRPSSLPRQPSPT